MSSFLNLGPPRKRKSLSFVSEIRKTTLDLSTILFQFLSFMLCSKIYRNLELYYHDIRFSLRKEMNPVNPITQIETFWTLLKNDPDHDMFSFHFDTLQQLVNSNATKSIMEIEKKDNPLQFTIDGNKMCDMSLIDLPNGSETKLTLILGSVFYFLSHTNNMKEMFHNKPVVTQANVMQRYQGTRFRNLIVILCHNLFCLQQWESIIYEFIGKYATFFHNHFGKSFQCVIHKTNQFFNQDLGKNNEICFLIRLVQKNNVSLFVKCHDNYLVTSVVMLEDCHDIKSAHFNMTMKDKWCLLPPSFHFIYYNSTSNGCDFFDLNNIRVNSVLACIVGLQKYEDKKQKAKDHEENCNMLFRLLHSCRNPPFEMLHQELNQYIKQLRYYDMEIDYSGSNFLNVDDIMMFNTKETNFNLLRKKLESYHIVLTDSFLHNGFTLNQLSRNIQFQIDNIPSDDAHRKEKMILGMQRMINDTTCCICLSTCSIVSKKQKICESSNDDVDEVHVLLCCLNKIHSSCMQFDHCPFCKIESVTAIWSSIESKERELKPGMSNLMTYIETNPFKDHQKNPFSLYSRLQQVMNCFLDYVEKNPTESIRCILICKESRLNNFYIQLARLLPKDYRKSMKIYRYSTKNTIGYFHKNTEEKIQILTLPMYMDLSKKINMECINTILEIGDLVTEEQKETILFHSVTTKSLSKEFCYMKIQKTK